MRFTLDCCLPLFSKELIEQASRKRTYLVRVLMTVTVFAVGMAVYVSRAAKAGFLEFVLLGFGDDLFEFVVGVEILAIYLLVPVLVGSAISSERERQSLEILRVTPLSVWQIILEKYFSRLIPLLSLILVGLPLMGISYMLGGLEIEKIGKGVVVLLWSVLQLAAIAIFLSVFCRTTLRAVMTMYGIFMMLVLITLISNGSGVLWNILIYLVPVWEPMTGTLQVNSLRAGSVTIGWLLIATWCLAFKSTGKRVRLPKTRRACITNLPDEQPIRWRERCRDRMGVSKVLSPYVFLGWCSLVGIGLYLAIGQASPYWHRDNELFAMNMVTWGLSAIWMGIRCCNLFAEERSSQSLDLLLVTHLSPRELLLQKAAVMGWYRRFFFVALCFLVLCRYIMIEEGYADTQGWQQFTPQLHLRFLVYEVCAIYIFLSLAGWTAILIGLRCPHRMRAMGVMFGVLLGWNFLPAAITLTNDALPSLYFLAFLSPLVNLVVIEQPTAGARLFDGREIAVMPAIALIVFGAILCYIRTACLSRSGEWLKLNGLD